MPCELAVGFVAIGRFKNDDPPTVGDETLPDGTMPFGAETRIPAGGCVLSPYVGRPLPNAFTPSLVLNGTLPPDPRPERTKILI